MRSEAIGVGCLAIGDWCWELVSLAASPPNAKNPTPIALLLLFLFFATPLHAQTSAKPLTLQECVRLAIRNSPHSKVALANRDSAVIQANRERPVSHPNLYALISQIIQGPRVTTPYPGRNPAEVLPPFESRLDIVAEQTLYHAGGGAAKQRFKAQLSIADLALNQSLSELDLSVVKAFYDYQKALGNLPITEGGVAAALDFQKLVLKQIETGQAKPVDAKAAQETIEDALFGEVQAKNGLELARLNLNRLLGNDLTAPLEVAPELNDPSIPGSPDAATEVALQNRIEIKMLLQSIEAAKAGIALAKTGNQPTLTARGQLSERTPSAFQHEHYAAATLELHLPILDGDKTKQDTQEAKAALKKLEATLEETKQGIRLDVRQAWLKLKERSAKIRQVEAHRDTMEANRIVAIKAYEIGRGTALEAQNALREVSIALVSIQSAKLDLRNGEAEFRFSQGTLLDLNSLPKLLPGGSKP